MSHSSDVYLTYNCSICKNEQNDDDTVYTTWENSDFICSSCYKSSLSKQLYEDVPLNNLHILIKNNPFCDYCYKQIRTNPWNICKSCELNFCSNCKISICYRCSLTLSVAE